MYNSNNEIRIEYDAREEVSFNYLSMPKITPLYGIGDIVLLKKETIDQYGVKDAVGIVLGYYYIPSCPDNNTTGVQNKEEIPIFTVNYMCGLIGEYNETHGKIEFYGTGTNRKICKYRITNEYNIKSVSFLFNTNEKIKEEIKNLIDNIGYYLTAEEKGKLFKEIEDYIIDSINQSIVNNKLC